MIRIAITGASGQIATALREAIAAGAGLAPIVLSRPDFDLAHLETLAPAVETAKPDLLINAAAYTAVDVAETDAETAYRINAEAPGHLARISARLGIPLIQLSTDYVFDGKKGAPYDEGDPPNPLSVYGRSKLAGEEAVAAANPRHVILRTAWVYSAGGRNFVRSMLDLARQKPELAIVADQFGCPTSAADIAAAILDIAPRLIDPRADDQAFGIFHLAGHGATSWAGFAEAIFALARRHRLPDAQVRPIPASEFARPAVRPTDSRLDCGKIGKIHAIRLPDWRESLSAVIARVAQS